MKLPPEVKILFGIYALSGFIAGLLTAYFFVVPNIPVYIPPDPRGSPAFGVGVRLEDILKPNDP